MKKIIFYLLVAIAISTKLSAQDITAIYYNEAQDLIAWGEPNGKNSKIIFANLNGEIRCEISFNAKYASLKKEQFKFLFAKEEGIFVLTHVDGKDQKKGDITHSAGISVFDVKNEKLVGEFYPQPDIPSANFTFVQIIPEKSVVVFSLSGTTSENGTYVFDYVNKEIVRISRSYYYGPNILYAVTVFQDGILYNGEDKDLQNHYFFDFEQKKLGEKANLKKPSFIMGFGLTYNGKTYITIKETLSDLDSNKILTSDFYYWDREKGKLSETTLVVEGGIPVLITRVNESEKYFDFKNEANVNHSKIISTAINSKLASIINNPSEIKKIKDQGEIQTIDFLLNWESKLSSSEQGVALFQKLLDAFDPLNPKEIEYLLTKSSNLKMLSYKPYIDWLQTTSEQILASDGLDANKSRVKICDDYKNLIKKKSISEEYWVNDEIIDAVKAKLQPLTQEMYYLSDSTLLATAEQKILFAKMVGTSGAVMTVPYYVELERREPKNYIHKMKLGDTYLLAGHYFTANEYYQKVLSLKPNYAPALYGQFMCLYTPFKNGEIGIDEQLSKDIITSANKLKTTSTEYLVEKTEALVISSFFQLYLSDRVTYEEYTVAQNTTGTQARIAAFESAIPKLKASKNMMLIASTKYVLASEYLKLGGEESYAKADGLLKEAILGGVELPSLYVMRVTINDKYFGKFDESRVIIKAGRAKFPKDEELRQLDGEFLFSIAKTQYEKNQYNQVIGTLEQYMTTRDIPAIEASAMLGYAYLQTKNNEKALTNLTNTKNAFNSESYALAYFPNLNTLIDYAKKPTGSVPELLSNMDKILEIQKEMGLVVKASSEKKYMDAQFLLSDIEKQSKEINYIKGVALAKRNMAIIYSKMNQPYNSIDQFERSIEADPTVVENYIDIAKTYMGLKKYDNAIAILDKADKEIPGNAIVQSEYANVYADRAYEQQTKKNIYSAISYFKKSLSYNDFNASVHMSLGVVYYSRSKTDPDAKSEIRRALELDPSLEEKFPVLKDILGGTFGSTTVSKIAGTKNYCYTALMKKDEGTTTIRTVYAAMFIQITAPEGASESAVKNFGRGKANMQTNGFQIFDETIQLDKECSDCKQDVSARFTLSSFRINHETMR